MVVKIVGFQVKLGFDIRKILIWKQILSINKSFGLRIEIHKKKFKKKKNITNFMSAL